MPSTPTVPGNVSDVAVRVTGRATPHVVIAGLAAVTAAAFWLRAAYWWDGAIGGLLIGLALLHLVVAIGAWRAVFVADTDGVAVRLLGGWLRLPWRDVERLVVDREPGHALAARLTVLPRDDLSDAAAGPARRLHLWWNRRWYGSPLSVPLGPVAASDPEELRAGLVALADSEVEVVCLALPDPFDDFLDGATDRATCEAPDASTVVPLAEGDADLVVAAVPGDADTPPDAEPPDVTAAESLRPVRADVTAVIGDGANGIPAQRAAAPAASPAQRSGAPSQDDGDLADGTALGERLSGARQRAGLSVARLAERTSIRPHVIEAMEHGDFSACGGDFYARGHLTGIARCLGLDPEPLAEAFDASYAHGTLAASEVFDADLGGGLVDTARARGRSRWTLVAAAVVSLAMVWGLAHLLGDEGEQLVVAPPSGPAVGLAGNQQPIVSPRTETTRITIRARGAAVRVVVRDRDATVVWSGDLRAGERRRLAGVAPFRVRADNGKAADVLVNGIRRGTVGSDDGPSVRTFANRG